MNETLFNIIVNCIPILAMIVTGVLIPLIISKLGNEKLTTIILWVGRGIKAAEMLFFPEAKSGEAKKAYVIDFIDNLFNKRKVVITREQIEILIESAVAEMNGK